MVFFSFHPWIKSVALFRWLIINAHRVELMYVAGLCGALNYDKCLREYE
ncbi:MAG: hypothetical protein RL179_778 [Planctomycetota bacterium]|jgi:hypothetical protein